MQTITYEKKSSVSWANNELPAIVSLEESCQRIQLIKPGGIPVAPQGEITGSLSQLSQGLMVCQYILE